MIYIYIYICVCMYVCMYVCMCACICEFIMNMSKVFKSKCPLDSMTGFEEPMTPFFTGLGG